MWNFLVGGLLTGAAIVLYDGNPGHPGHRRPLGPRRARRHHLLRDERRLHRGLHEGRRRAGRGRDLSRLRAVGSTGSPLSPEGFRLGLRARRRATPGSSRPAAAPTSAPPSSAASRCCPSTAASSRAARSAPRSRPSTSTASRRRRGRRAGDHRADAVDAALLLGRHGRLALPRQLLRRCTRASGATATGSRSPRAAPRSSTAARTRRSTAAASAWAPAEIYRAVLRVPEVADALVVDVPRDGTEGWMPLFVVLREGAELDDELDGEIKRRIREHCSPRHVPERDLPDRRGPADAERARCSRSR